MLVSLGLVLAGAGSLGAQIPGSGPIPTGTGERPVAFGNDAEVADEARFVELINELRVSEGLPPLTVHPVLVPLARTWAEHLRTQGSLSHTADLSVGIDLTWTRLGENVGVGPIDQVQALFDAFVASPSHYANLVKDDYRYVGIGVVHGNDGRIWTAHRFMALDETTPAPSRPGSVPSPTVPVAPSPATAPAATPTGPVTPESVPAAPESEPEPAGEPLRPLSPAFVARLSGELEQAGI